MIRPPAIALAALSICLFAGIASAQEKGGISGHVADKKTGHALPFASITVMGAQRGGLTDSQGEFRITGIPAGSWEVRVQFLGYKVEARPGVVIAPGKTTPLDFMLEDIVVHQEKVLEVTGERRLVEVKEGATRRTVTGSEIRNLPVQTINDVLQQQAGINTEGDQIHVRGGRLDETAMVINGVANRDLVTGQATAGQLNARSIEEVNVATGAYDVRYGNAISGVVDVRLKEGGDRFSGGFSTSGGTWANRAFQVVVAGPDPLWQPALKRVGLRLPGTVTSILDVSGNLFETRFRYLGNENSGFWNNTLFPAKRRRIRSSYEDSFLGHRFTYGDLFSPSADNRWSARYGLTWKLTSADKLSLNFSKRLGIDQGFSRTNITASGDLRDPTYPWVWDHRIDNAGNFFEDNVQSSIQWRRSFGTTGYSELQLSRYYYARRYDVQGKMWWEYEEPDDRALSDPSKHADYFIDSGDDNTWEDRRATNVGLQWNYVQRVNRHNELELGFEHQAQSVQYVVIQDPWVFDVSGLGGAHDLWKVQPWVGDLYVRDKLEFEGFVGNVGLRSDYWFIGPEAERAMADTSNHNITDETRTGFRRDTRYLFGRRFKLHISPRVMVSHPIGESSKFYFNYGEYTQIPSYRFVYSKLTSVSSEAFPTQGNPNLNPQVSVNYEVGAQHQFLPKAAANLAFFVKDVYDYPTATTFRRTQGASLVDIFVYLNGHFARAKGFELEVEKRRSNYWSGKISYTYQQTKGKSGDPNEQKVVQENGGDASETRLSEAFVAWNRPHKVSVNFDLRFDREAPSGFGWLKQSGLNVYVQGQSGPAYTPVSLTSSQSAEPNSRNAIFQIKTDVRLNRFVTIAGRKLDLGFSGLNVFNNHLINSSRVDPVTGHGRVWGVGVYDPSEFNVTNYTRVSEVNDPSNYGPGATWRFTVDYDF